MAKTGTKSWLPKRTAPKGRLAATTLSEVRSNPLGEAVSATGTHTATDAQSAGGRVRSSVSGRIELPNGHSIATVRKDVMDSALGRGDFKKK